MSRLPLFKHPFLYYKSKWRYHRCKYAEAPQGRVVKKINGVKLVFDLSLGKAVKSMYFDAYEIEVIRIMKKYLKPGGVFIDVGANVGYLSAIGLSLVGTTGQVHSFEPMPAYFSYLEQIAELNPQYKIVANKLALGQADGKACITSHRHGTGCNSMVPGFIPKEHIAETLNIHVWRLDEYIQKQKLSRISLIKIDTEGFELPVLLGTSRFFDDHKGNLPPIIVEITPRAFKLMNKNVSELEEFMASYGYKPYAICGRHHVDIRNITEQIVTLFKA